MKEIQDIDLKQLIEDETGQRFNRQNKIKSPFNPMDKNPSFGIWFNSNRNKWMFKDFSSGEVGDCLDFIIKYRGLDYKQARQYLGMEVELTPKEQYEEKIKQFVDYQLQGFKKGYKVLGIFTFVDENNKPIYSKVKFLKPDGGKETPYYSIETDGQVVNKRNHDEVPYNYYNLLNGIAENKTVVFVEGEKDVNTLSSKLSKEKYVVSSLKGIKDYSPITSEFMKICVIGDTGKAGEEYIWSIRKAFIKYASMFKIINLPGLKQMGDNKDVTDWFEAGHTKSELYTAFKRSLDLKNKNELQQDSEGVYKTWFGKEDENGEKPEHKKYLTNFNVLEAHIMYKVDEEQSGMYIKIKSCITGREQEIIAPSTMFNDQRSFRSKLNTEFTFLGEKIGDLNKLKDWITMYFAVDNMSLYNGAQFILNDKDNMNFVDSKCCISDNKVDYTKKSENTNINLSSTSEISTEELKQLKKYLFDFIPRKDAYCVIGSTINYLAIGQAKELGVKFHFLSIFGESGSGKSTILEQILMPLLNIPLQNKQSMASSPFIITNALSTGNYPVVFDEYKPSKMNANKQQKISDILRNAYDRAPINRGDKSFKVKEFRLEAPMIMAGEEGYLNDETALVTRSCIVYISENDRTPESHDATFWLIDHKDLLNKLGKSLVMEVLKMPVEEYQDMRDGLKSRFSILKDRAYTTAINIGCGIEILNNVFERHGLDTIKGYEAYIIENIRNEVLDGGDKKHSSVEQMLCMYDDMIQNGAYSQSYEGVNEPSPLLDTIHNDEKTGRLYIKTSEMINYIFKYDREYNGSYGASLLKLKDFRKQAQKAGYIVKNNAKQFALKSCYRSWFDEYDFDKVLKLGCENIADADLLEKVIRARERDFQVYKNE